MASLIYTESPMRVLLNNWMSGNCRTPKRIYVHFPSSAVKLVSSAAPGLGRRLVSATTKKKKS